MADSIFTVPIEFTSHDGRTRVNAKLWTSTSFGSEAAKSIEAPRGVIQIVHGMAEHIERYDHFARYLVEQGFVVCAEDHIGHGRSAAGEGELGHMPLADGLDILVGDVHTLHCMVRARFPEAPYVLYGHSMGSLISRVYITRYGTELSACVLAGTAHGPIFMSRVGEVLAHLIASVKGDRYRSKFLDSVGVGSYGKKIADARTPLDWLSNDPAVVDDYMADPLSGQMFSVGAYGTLLGLVHAVTSPQWAQAVPKDLPILFIAGDQDPVGDMGRGVQAAAKLLQDAGVHNVQVRIYPGLRHELHNEAERLEIFGFVVEWIESVI